MQFKNDNNLYNYCLQNYNTKNDFDKNIPQFRLLFSKVQKKKTLPHDSNIYIQRFTINLLYDVFDRINKCFWFCSQATKHKNNF